MGNSELFGTGNEIREEPYEPFEQSEAVEAVFTELMETLDNGELSEMKNAEMLAAYIDATEMFTLDNWEQLTLDERVEVLQCVEDFSAAMNGRDPLKVELFDGPATSLGYMSWEEKKIGLNSAVVSSNDMEALVQSVDTVVHEGRHAYQKHNVFVERIEPSDEKFQSWMANEELGYFSPQAMGFQLYYIQPVEVDARVFAESVVNNISFR